jgi:signal transduction histidine kinase
VRSLFAKILLWFLFTVIVTFTLTFYISSIFMNSREPQNNGLVFEMREARQAWETQGKAGLEGFYERFKEASGGEARLADSAGHDILTGEDLNKEIKAVGPRGNRGYFRFLPFVRVENNRGGFVMSTRSRDRKYYMIAKFPPRENIREGWSIEVPPQTWWMLAIFAVFSYALARRLTSPLRRMQKTIERFGKGDFSARVNTRRADELGQLGRTIDRMAERIEELLGSQRRLLQDISHELRSPLARLGVAVELGRGGGSATTAFDRIEREADRLNTLVGELIQVTRAEGETGGPLTENMRLDELIEIIVNDVRIEAERHQIELKLDVCEADMEGNPELLRRAIENIIRNAIRYSPDGGKVNVKLTCNEASYRLIVRDYGTGVPEDALAHIFDPFYRVESDRGRTSGGVGLGLAIAKRAVDLHHGALHARNVHPGLEVEIDLPAPALTPASAS